ncbi:MAG TPA: glycosyl hydrolase [Paenibacillus sp.]|nr:glycosyl hydrolase [Paenibacillus sp.]
MTISKNKPEKLITIEAVLKKIEELLSQLTLDEKIGMIHSDNVYNNKGVDRLGIPAFYMSDGPTGVRMEYDRETIQNIGNSNETVLSLPCSTAVAATWNTELAYLHGKTLGSEVRGRGKDVSLSPGINIHRTPLCGRNFEYQSEDPYLVSKMAVGIIKGLQDNDIASCVKHFVANNQEVNRFSVNVEIDDRTLHEIYMPAFKAAIVEGNSYSIMGAYNKFRGEYCCQSKYLLKDVLRDEWGFDGVIISDWGAVHDTKKAIDAGTDFDMDIRNTYDDFYFANPLKAMVEAGEIDEENVNERIRRILKLMFKLKIFDKTRNKGAYNSRTNSEAILEVARESIVLLKNDKQILPLSEEKIKKIVVIGENADRLHAFGGGSSEVRALYEITPLLGINMYLGGNTEIVYSPGYTSDKGADAEQQKVLSDKACELAANCDACIYVGGLNHDFDTEAYDRNDLKLPYGQDELIQKLLKINPNMVIVNMSGSPVEMGEWINEAHAVVQYWYSGSEGGTALAEVIFGAVNPSGKLTTTFPKRLEDTPVYHFGEYPGDENVTYNEGVFVGYRYYDTYMVEPEFCFGHGLSYTDFEYNDIETKVTRQTDGKGMAADILVTVTNEGKVAGADVVQLYITDKESSVDRPLQELKGFRKVRIDPGETKTVKFTLKTEDFSFYSMEDSGWKFEDGKFVVSIGRSSRDIRLKAEI